MRKGTVNGMPLVWKERSERSLAMNLAPGGEEWVEVKALGHGPLRDAGWGVEACLGGTHYRLGDAFPRREIAQGCALLLAMRLLPVDRREVLHAALDEVPGAWWWKITPGDDADSQRRSIISTRIAESQEAAERSGRAAGAGWWLNVYGPGGSLRTCGLVPR
ncbi:MAG TPA: hypothetical protein VMU15_00610 [Anaeromyxobacter sp.]|nr:hypothetical protein [Anaeromyxobacter sp.]